MKKDIFLIRFSLCLIFCFVFSLKNEAQDSEVNNLVHSAGYKTSQYGEIPQYSKSGKGKQTCILIPGWGFDASIFNDFIEKNKQKFIMYTVTIPGYGTTSAPPMPPEITSYGDQTWNKSVIIGLAKLIDKEGLNKPIIVGHFVQGTQLALRMAIDHPDKVGGVIILGGPAKFIVIMEGKPVEFPLNGTISYIDNNTAPKWFKPISKNAFDDGNYLPEIYSLDSVKGSKFWKQSAAVPLPVMVRYLCEFFASDIKIELGKIKCPVLVLRARFNNNVLEHPINNYVRPQFIDSWNNVSDKNPLIKVVDVPEAASFVWKDNPNKVYSEIVNFIVTNKKTTHIYPDKKSNNDGK